MRAKMALFVGAMIPTSMLASPQVFYPNPCVLLNRLLVGENVQSKGKALGVVKQIALGRISTLSADAEVQVGLTPGLLRERDYSLPEVRACAFRAMGVSGMAEAEEFLAKLTHDDIGPDDTQLIWRAAQVALREIRFLQMSDAQARTLFLEQTITEPHDAVSNATVQAWAIEKLCNRGALNSMALIQRTIRKWYSGERAEDDIQFCEARMQVASHGPDRVKTLGSVLTLSNGENNGRLTNWAIAELMSLQSSESDAELDRFSDEIGKLPVGHPGLERLWVYRQTIQQMHKASAK